MTRARLGPDIFEDSSSLSGGLRPPDPLTPSLARAPVPRSAPPARCLRSLAGALADFDAHNQNVKRTPSWITRFELARTPLIDPKAGLVWTPVAKSKVATVFTPWYCVVLNTL